jgi:hypothetical protein
VDDRGRQPRGRSLFRLKRRTPPVALAVVQSDVILGVAVGAGFYAVKSQIAKAWLRAWRSSRQPFVRRIEADLEARTLRIGLVPKRLGRSALAPQLALG